MQTSIKTNDEVLVRLTPAGQSVLLDWVAAVTIPAKSNLTVADQLDRFRAGDGLSKFQVHTLMNIFGPKMWSGGVQMFESNIIITQPNT